MALCDIFFKLCTPPLPNKYGVETNLWNLKLISTVLDNPNFWVKGLDGTRLDPLNNGPKNRSPSKAMNHGYLHLSQRYSFAKRKASECAGLSQVPPISTTSSLTTSVWPVPTPSRKPKTTHTKSRKHISFLDMGAPMGAGFCFLFHPLDFSKDRFKYKVTTKSCTSSGWMDMERCQVKLTKFFKVF